MQPAWRSVAPPAPRLNPPLEIVEEGVDFKELEEGCFFRDVDIYKGDMVGFGSLHHRDIT